MLLTPKDFEDYNPLSTTSRRVFIKGLGFVSVSLILSTLGGCDQLAEAIFRQLAPALGQRWWTT